MRRREPLAALAVVVLAVAVLLLGAPTWLACTVLVLATSATVVVLAARRRRGGVDAVVAGAGLLLTTLVLVGVLTDLAGVRLTRTSWALGLGAVAALCLVWSAVRAAAPAASEPTTARLGRLRRRDLGWFVAAAAVVALAITLSTRTVDRLDVAAVAFSVARTDGPAVQVELSSGTAAGPYEIRTQSPDGNSVSYPLVTLRAGQTVRTTVDLPRKGRYVITLNNPGQDRPVRTLTVDR